MRRTLHAFWLILINVLLQTASVVAQQPPQAHNPKIDLNISPGHNPSINPQTNHGINPKMNSNINPMLNSEINPVENKTINPRVNEAINPLKNQLLSPLMYKHLYPTSGSWKGLYIYNEKDNLIGYITKPSRDVLICFDVKGMWTCYYVLTAQGTYNHFDIDGNWTGDYICSDMNAGFNVFNKDGEWTGKHIK
jgi:hypothetical protein